MAFPSVPTNFQVQQANRQVWLNWAISAGATSYQVQRSTDGVNFTLLASPTINNYLDTAVTVGTLYYYQVAATNTGGTSPYTSAQATVHTPTGEMSLCEIRYKAKQRADMINSQFISDTEWNTYINQSLFELYDILITTYEDYYIAPPIVFTTVANQNFYPLPDGALTFNNQQGTPFVAQPFYKLRGVDLGINSANNAFVTVGNFNFEDRNRYVYPNTASTIYGVFNLQYRVMGNQIEFIPPPSANQPIQIWYIPRMVELLQDTDITTQSVSGWIEYVIVKAAYLALCKEESDTNNLVLQLTALTKRIEETAQNRDAGRPQSITDVRTNGKWGTETYGYGGSGPTGGY